MSDATAPTPPASTRPVLVCFHHGDDARLRYDLPDAVRTSLNSMDKPERRRSRRNGGHGSDQDDDKPNQFEVNANMIRAAEGVLTGSHFLSEDDRFAAILRTQIPIARTLLNLAYYSAHPDSNLLRGRVADPSLTTSPEGKILSDPVLNKATEDTIDDLATILDRSRIIRTGATGTVAGLFDRLKINGGTELLRKSPLSDESVCARAMSKLENDIMTQINRINDLTKAPESSIDPIAQPYYDAAKLLLEDARAHLSDWRASIPGLPDKSASHAL